MLKELEGELVHGYIFLQENLHETDYWSNH